MISRSRASEAARRESRSWRQPDPALLAAAWGVPWGLALGMWLLAPAVLHTHHLRPANLVQWTVAATGLGAVFAALGALLALFGGFALVLAERTLTGPLRERTWAYGLFTGPLLVVAYAANCLLIHWFAFRSFRGLGPYRASIAPFGLPWLVTWVAFGVLYVRISRHGRRFRSTVLAQGLVALAIAGAVTLPARGPRPLPPAPALEGLSSLGDRNADVPLLFIGLDGATWRVLRPAMESGLAPTLAALTDEGMQGTVEALWPPYWSGAAWGSILTGLPRDVTGVYEDLAATTPGLPFFQAPLNWTPVLHPLHATRAFLAAARIVRYVPPPRRLLNGKPVWELLHQAGVDAAVVRFRFTYPPAGQANVVISDWIGADGWENVGVRRRALPDRVAPKGRAAELLAPFTSERLPDHELLADLLPGQASELPDDTHWNPVEQLREAVDIDRRTFDAAELILARNPSMPFLAIYLDGLDAVQHAFWPYRFPEDFPHNPPTSQDIKRLGPVPDRYVRLFDRRLSRLLAFYAQNPNIVIISDHGQGPSTDPSKMLLTRHPTDLTRAAAWHNKDGIFLAAGPSVPRGATPTHVSYYDIVPTILHLKGFRTPAPLRGRSLLLRAAGTHKTD